MLRKISFTFRLANACSFHARSLRVASTGQRSMLSALSDEIADLDRQAYCWFREKVAATLNFSLHEDCAPRARYYPDSRHITRDITVHDIYNGDSVFKDNLTNFAYKLHHYVTTTDPYFTQSGELPSSAECFSVADCLRGENEWCVDFKGDPGGNMIQYWLELTTTGSAKKLSNLMQRINKHEFEQYYSFVENTNDVVFDVRDGGSKKYVIVEKNETFISCLQLVGKTIETGKCMKLPNWDIFAAFCFPKQCQQENSM